MFGEYFIFDEPFNQAELALINSLEHRVYRWFQTGLIGRNGR